MKALLLFILLLCQLTTVNGQQTGCRIPVTLLSLDLGLSSTQTAQSSQPIAQGEKDTVVSSPLSVDYHINQINLADSLYKNYLPQYNYDEVKAAVEFFEKQRTLESENLRNVDNSTSQVLKFSDSQFLYQCARAHYYHAVGLAERDDIVGACEHYLKALEIMLEDETLVEMYGRASKGKSLKTKGRKSQVSQPIAQGTEEYEKTRFMALIYTRLGRLFYNEAYCDLSIQKYEKALIYYDIIKDSASISSIYKMIGNTNHLSGNYDSALYYYKESLRANSNISNKLDVEKSIAFILFEKGERDSAYCIMKKNIANLNNYSAKDSYYATLGEMYYKDKEYDSAIYYFELSLDTQNEYTVLTVSNYLSEIYNTFDNVERKSYYDSVSLAILNKINNSSVKTGHVQNTYERYKEKKHEQEKMTLRRIYLSYLKYIGLICVLIIIIMFIVRYKHFLKTKHLNEENSSLQLSLSDTLLKLEEHKKLLAEKNNQLDIANKNILDIDKDSIINYYNCEICTKIYAMIDNIKMEQLKINNIKPLSNEDLTLLKMSADKYLNNYVKILETTFPKLKGDDIDCICLAVLNIKEPTIAALLNKSYNAIWSRMKKIRSIMRINSNEELLNF